MQVDGRRVRAATPRRASRRAGSPSKRIVVGPPCWKSTAPVYRSITISVPVRVDSTADELAVDHQVEGRRRARLGAELDERELHVELDRRRVGDHLEPAARRHRLEHRQRDVVVLHPRPRRHAVQHDPALGGLELDDPGRPHGPAEDVDRRSRSPHQPSPSAATPLSSSRVAAPSSGFRRELHRREVGGAGLGEGPHAGEHLVLGADERHVGRPAGALGVHHAAVGRQVVVARQRRRDEPLHGVGVLGDAHRHGRDDPRRRTPGLGGGRVEGRLDLLGDGRGAAQPQDRPGRPRAGQLQHPRAHGGEHHRGRLDRRCRRRRRPPPTRCRR